MNNNIISLEGNLTRDPEYKTTGQDRDLAVLRMAVNERLNKEKEETLYIDVNAWGYLVPYCKEVNLAKGDRVLVRGRLKEDSWTDKESQAPRSRMVVVPDKVSKIMTRTRS